MIDKSRLFKIAHSILRRSKASSFSEALRMAWKAIKVYSQMLVGKATFTFRKANGEIRKAIGTLCNIDYHPSGNASKGERAADCICYWDVEKNSFRSFNASTLL